MRYKKIIIMLVIAIFIFGVASVCASDVNDMATASADDSPVELPESGENNEIGLADEIQTIGEPGNGEIIGVPDDGTFAALDNKIKTSTDSTIKLENDYLYEGEGYKYGITIDRSDITIDGQGHKIDADGRTRIFNVQANNVVIKNITFLNGYTYDGGGAISFDGDGTVINCSFTNNAAVVYGGAISFYGNATVMNCNFTNNDAIEYGGAIYFYDGQCSVTNCNFINNTAGQGGAVLLNGKSEVTNSNFINNTADRFGASSAGAVWMNSGSVENCNFTDNAAFNRGGAIYANTGTVTNCNFIKSSAKYGGAINFDGVGTVADCNFTDNTADYFGGAIDFGGFGTVANCYFTDNSASYRGGALYFLYDGGNVTNCNFDDNSADQIGGAVFFNDNGNVAYCNFSNNSANYGGAIYFWNTGIVTNSNFINNTAFDGGGAIGIDSGRIENCTFVECSANNEGGGVNIYGGSGNSLVGCTFSGCSAGYGGGVSMNDTSGNSLVGCIFTDCSAGYGGGVYIYGASGNSLVGCTFADCSANDYGGGIFINEGSDNFLDNCSFVNNYVRLYGGAIYLNCTAGSLVSACSFVNNSVYFYGGAIFSESCTDGVVSGCSFADNSANSGGAIYLDESDDYVVSGCSFVNNSASNLGGAVYWDESDGGLLSGCSFENNYARIRAGAVYWEKGAAGNVSACSFVNNSADNHGGAIYWDSAADGAVSGCSFADNFANGTGGAIYWYLSDSGIVSRCSFVNNSADDAGAVYLFSNDCNVSGCIFVNNRADDEGILRFRNANKHNLSVNDNIFLNNDAVAIYFINSDSTSNADYNWFGNNATNYDVAPTTYNVEIGTWLFLNATANPDSISVSESSDILFKLYSYGSGGVSDYDNSKLPVVNLTVTANNGDVDKDTVVLGDSVEYTYDGGGDASVTAAIENAEYTIVLDVAKPDSVLSADDLVMAYRDGSAWAVSLTDADGNPIADAVVKVGIAGKVYNRVTDADGVASLPINLISGTYAINATFEGDGDYEASFTNATVTVNRAAAVLTGFDLEMTYKDGSSWVVALSDADGNAIAGVKVAIGVSGKVYNIKTDDDGNAVLPINLPSGTYTVNASFTDSRYEAELITATVIVDKAIPVLSAENLVMNYKDGSAWSVTLTDADGNVMADTYVKLTVAGKTYTRKTGSDGVVSLPINLGVGNYTVSASFDGSSNLDAVEINRTIVVNPPVYDLVAEDVDMVYQDGTSYNVQITDGEGNPVAQAGVVIKVTINGKSYDRKTNDDGIASLPINLRAGTYEITAEYNGKVITNTIVVNNA